VFGRLVPLPVFKTGVARDPGQAGSIPVRLRCRGEFTVSERSERTIDPGRERIAERGGRVEGVASRSEVTP
jgi:hypothetical protein